MNTGKRIIWVLLLFLIPSFNISANNIYTIEIPDFVKNEAKDESKYKGDELPKEYLNNKDKNTKACLLYTSLNRLPNRQH